MSKLLLTILTLFLSFSFIMTGTGWSEEILPSNANYEYETLNDSIMRPDRATRLQWMYEYETAERAPIDAEIQRRLEAEDAGDLAKGPAPILLDHITYTPSERNQGSCGNCWAWAGTGVLEIMHSVSWGVKDRLSLQWLDSCRAGWACCGGNLGGFVNFYNTAGMDPRPWWNTNAQFQDGGRTCAMGSSLVGCGSIGTNPFYTVVDGSLVAQTITTTGVTQATAIANIKNILNQNKGVYYAFWLANNTDWNAFFNFWNNQDETVLWNPDPYSGHTWVVDQGGGHAVVIVGYNDDDAANPYWIVLNSWGTNAHRPNGLFRLRMNINYEGFIDDPGGDFYFLQFQTISSANITSHNKLYQAVKGATNNNIYVRSYSGGWGSWSAIGGTTSHAPAMAVFNGRQYMFVKGATNNNIYYRNMNNNGAWSGWSTMATGGTGTSPALVVFKNKLYIFVKGATNDVIYYASLSTGGTWSAWSEVPGSHTYDTPAVVVLDNQIVLHQTGWDNKIYLRTMASDGTWSGWAYHYGGSSASPAATIFQGSLWLFAKGATNNNIYLRRSVVGDPWLWYNWEEVPGGGQTSTGPYAATYGSTAAAQAFVGVKGVSSNMSYQKFYDSIEATWSTWASAGGSTDALVTNMYYFGGP